MTGTSIVISDTTIRSTTTSLTIIEFSSSHQLRVPTESSGSNEEPPTTSSIVSTLVASLMSVAVVATVALTVFIYWRKYRKKNRLDRYVNNHTK